jgi:hypothetical protein
MHALEGKLKVFFMTNITGALVCVPNLSHDYARFLVASFFSFKILIN